MRRVVTIVLSVLLIASASAAVEWYSAGRPTGGGGLTVGAITIDGSVSQAKSIALGTFAPSASMIILENDKASPGFIAFSDTSHIADPSVGTTLEPGESITFGGEDLAAPTATLEGFLLAVETAEAGYKLRWTAFSWKPTNQ